MADRLVKVGVVEFYERYCYMHSCMERYRADREPFRRCDECGHVWLTFIAFRQHFPEAELDAVVSCTQCPLCGGDFAVHDSS